jgi:hypothetical protein
MKLLVVVDKLLTRFDAPPCTFLYIDKSMQDHGLFRAIQLEVRSLECVTSITDSRKSQCFASFLGR